MTTEVDPDEPAWERVKEIVADALEREPDARRAYVAAACEGEPALRAEVDSLLADAATSDAFLATPATALFELSAPEPGARLGQYTLRSVIGEGGMGRVYEATQERPHRTVALKVLRPGFLSGDAERRFRWEVEALGRLNHPAIAQVHDAGVETMPDGHSQSWFAMERVDGRPLLEAADALGFDRAARLALFLRVSDGVAHAHQRGVIHRDLKPDNILVDERGDPHLLDFGIARAADPLASSVTTAGELIGTLAYMSPEQVLGEPDRVDARSDVYALGVLLFRLLTGQPPLVLDGLSLPKVALRLSTEEPRRAGDIDRSLRGDLETVLATALARDVERRYATVEAFATDVRHVLADQPITARPPTALYQLSKFARRHRALVGAAAVALLALFGAVIGTSVGLVRAERALARAELDRDRTREANGFLKRILASASPDIEGRDVRVVDLLDGATAELEGATGFEPSVRAGLHLTLGETYRRLGLPEPARAHLVTAAADFEATDGPNADTTLEAQGALCEVLVDLGDLTGASAALARVRDGLAQRPDAPLWLELRPLELAANLAGVQGDLAGQLAGTRALFEGWLERLPEGDDRVETARTNLSTALLASSRGAEAETLLARGIEVLQGTLGAEHSRVLTMRANHAQAVAECGERERALELFDALEPAALREWGARHPKTMALRNNRAGVLQELGRAEEALAIFETELALNLELHGERHRDTVSARNNVAVVLMELERYEPAEAILRATLAALEGPLGEEDPVTLVRTEMNLAAALSGLDRKPQALLVSARVLGRLEDLVGEAHVQSLISRNNHAILLMELGQTQAAVETARRNLALAREHHPDLPYIVFPFRMNLGRTLAADGQFAAAEVELLATQAALSADPNTPATATQRLIEVLAELREARGRAGDGGQPDEPNAPTRERLVDACRAYTTDGVFGTRYAFHWRRQTWYDVALDPREGDEDPVGGALAAVVASAPPITFDVRSALAAILAAGEAHVREHASKVATDSSERIVLRFDDRYRTEYLNRSGSAFAYASDAVCLSGGPAVDLVHLYPNRRRVSGAKSLAADLLDSFPESARESPAWWAETEWSAATAAFEGRRRVRFASSSGYLGDPSAACVIVFEERGDALAPIVHYETDSFDTVLTLFEYTAGDSLSNAAAPIPVGRCRLAYGSDRRALIERDQLEQLPPPTGADELKLHLRRGCVLASQPAALSPDEAADLDRSDPATWPPRVLDAVVFD